MCINRLDVVFVKLVHQIKQFIFPKRITNCHTITVVAVDNHLNTQFFDAERHWNKFVFNTPCFDAVACDFFEILGHGF